MELENGMMKEADSAFVVVVEESRVVPQLCFYRAEQVRKWLAVGCSTCSGWAGFGFRRKVSETRHGNSS